MSSPEERLGAPQRRMLLDVARRSIEHGLRQHRPLEVDAADFDLLLREPRATFVTLRHSGALRGCVGTLEVQRPLVHDVANSAFKAAFRDPRFPDLDEKELHELELHISVLSPLEPLSVTSEQDLLLRLRPGIDGLRLRDAGYDGTFLPSVWETLPEAADFVRQLKVKMGLPLDHWSAGIAAYRYTVESIS